MTTHYLEFEVKLLKVKPPLWRRFLLRQRFSFENLHEAIQLACGWSFRHMFEFLGEDDRVIAADENTEDKQNSPRADRVTLTSYFKQPGKECRYIYDFGDYWEHRVRFVQMVILPERFGQRLIGGEGTFPPEDCGGVRGYEECVQSCMLTPVQIKGLSPKEREHILTLKEWLGNWRPDGCDLKKAREKFER